MSEKPTTIKYIIGIDEVGRGPLAGPVTVCAFAVAKHHIKYLDSIDARDSKKLSSQKREKIAQQLKDLACENKCAFHIVSRSSKIIDSQGLTKAIFSAIITALEKLEQTLGIHPGNMDIYLDGGLSAGKRYFRQKTIIHGDAQVKVISCASILAKVHRDRLMDAYDLKFPAYGFLNHKGYGTVEHYKAITKNGMCEIHRRLFFKKTKKF